MFDYYMAVTDRKVCKGDFLAQIEKVTSYSVQALFLCEPDLNEAEYEALAKPVLEICRTNDTDCILVSYPEVARRLGCLRINMDMAHLRRYAGTMEDFVSVGSYCNTVEEVLEAEALGADYVLFGSVFPGNHHGGKPVGLDALREACRKANLPVFAFGGVTPGNLPQVLSAGAVGGCMCWVFMTL